MAYLVLWTPAPLAFFQCLLATGLCWPQGLCTSWLCLECSFYSQPLCSTFKYQTKCLISPQEGLLLLCLHKLAQVSLLTPHKALFLSQHLYLFVTINLCNYVSAPPLNYKLCRATTGTIFLSTVQQHPVHRHSEHLTNMCWPNKLIDCA